VDTTATLTPAHHALFYLLLLLFITTTNWLPTYATQEQVLAKNMWTDHLLNVKNIQIYAYLNPAFQESKYLNQQLPSFQILINTSVRALNVSGSFIQLVICPLHIPKEKQFYQSKN
jgi:hypothetical protein